MSCLISVGSTAVAAQLIFVERELGKLTAGLDAGPVFHHETNAPALEGCALILNWI